MVIFIFFFIGFILTFVPLLATLNKSYNFMGKLLFFGMFVFLFFGNVYFYILVFDIEFLISLCYPIAMSIGIIVAIPVYNIFKKKY